MYGNGTYNGVANYFTQPGGPFTQVFPALPQAQPWPEFPGPSSMVFSYGPWIMPGCLHPIHGFRIIQEFDYDTNQLVSLLTCSCCQYVQRAVEGVDQYGPTAVYNPLTYAVIV